MSTTEGRRERMQRILKLLKKNPSGLEANEIALETDILTEITMDRLYKYLQELHWCGKLIIIQGKYALNIYAPSKTREREKIKERVKE